MAEQIKQRIVLEGAEAIQRQLEAIGKAGQEAFQKLQDASKQVGSVGGEQKLKEAVSALAQYNKALGESQRALTQTGRTTADAATATGKFSTEVKNVATDALQTLGVSSRFAEAGVNVLAGGLSALGGVARTAAIGIGAFGGAVALALPALTSLGRAASDAINKLAEIGQKTGLSANQVNQFRAQLAGIGVSAKDADSSLSAIGKVLDDLYSTSVKNAEGIKQNIRTIGQPAETVRRDLVKVGDGFITIVRASTEAGKEAKKQLDGLGGLIQQTLKIEPAKLAGKSIAELFSDLAVAISKIDDEKLRRIRLNQFSDLGVKGLEEEVTRLRAVGEAKRQSLVTISEADANAAEAAKRAAEAYKQTWSDLVISLGASFQGVGTQFDQLKTKFLESIISLSETIRTKGLSAALAQANDTANAGIEQNLFKPIEDFFSKARETYEREFSNTVEMFRQAGERIGQAISGVSGEVQKLEPSVEQTGQAVDSLTGELQQLDQVSVDIPAPSGGEIQLWEQLEIAVRNAADAIRSVPATSPSGGYDTEAFATGGYIRGRGTSTSDSILARLSNGEFVIKAAAVRKFGPSFFAALNNLRLPQFATGGLVNAMAMPSLNLSPSFELPGSGPALRPLAMTIGGQTFDMMAPEDTAQSLMRFATARQVRSNGRKPSWHGG